MLLLSILRSLDRRFRALEYDHLCLFQWGGVDCCGTNVLDVVKPTMALTRYPDADCSHGQYQCPNSTNF